MASKRDSVLNKILVALNTDYKDINKLDLSMVPEYVVKHIKLTVLAKEKCDKSTRKDMMENHNYLKTLLKMTEVLVATRVTGKLPDIRYAQQLQELLEESTFSAACGVAQASKQLLMLYDENSKTRDEGFGGKREAEEYLNHNVVKKFKSS